MSRRPDGPLVVVDLSNLLRDQRFLSSGQKADHAILDSFVDALESSDIAFSRLHYVSDRNLPSLLDPAGRRRLAELDRTGSLERSSLADDRLLDLAFGPDALPSTLVASMDNFDDYRRSYPSIQGSVDRFLGWAPGPGTQLQVVRRDMGVHAHQRLSRKEESSELKARRLRRRTIVQQAAETYFRCDNVTCLTARLWPDRLPELPRFDDRADQFVCPTCGTPVVVGEPRPPATQLIVFLHGVEHFRVLLDEAERIEVGRRDNKGCLGLESRVGAEVAAAISRRHVAFTRAAGQICVEDLGSRNGTVLRWLDETHPEERLGAGAPRVIGRRNAVALPSGVTMELSGRSIPLKGERPPDTAEPAGDERLTRILATRR